MIDKKEAAPAKVTAKTKQQDKDISFYVSDNSAIAKYIIIPISIFKKQNIMEQVKACYLGRLVEAVTEKKEELRHEWNAATLLARYYPYDEEVFDECYERFCQIEAESEGVTASIPVKFYEAYEGRPDDELLEFRYYAAVRSIVGKKPYCWTTTDHIKARMVGYSKKNVPDFPDNEITRLTPSRLRKIRKNLEMFWHLAVYKTYRTYFSVKLDRKELMKRVISKGNKTADLKERKRAEEEEVYMELFGKTKEECRAELKAKREQRKAKEQAPKQDNDPVAVPEPKPEPTPAPTPTPTHYSDEAIKVEWLRAAEEISDRFPRLAQTMKANLPTIAGRKAIIKVRNEKAQQYFETSEYFIPIWSKIKSAAKMPDLMLVAEIDNDDDLLW